MVAQPCEHTKTHWNVHIKKIRFSVYWTKVQPVRSHPHWGWREKAKSTAWSLWGVSPSPGLQHRTGSSSLPGTPLWSHRFYTRVVLNLSLGLGPLSQIYWNPNNLYEWVSLFQGACFLYLPAPEPMLEREGRFVAVPCSPRCLTLLPLKLSFSLRFCHTFVYC